MVRAFTRPVGRCTTLGTASGGRGCRSPCGVRGRAARVVIATGHPPPLPYQLSARASPLCNTWSRVPCRRRWNALAVLDALPRVAREQRHEGDEVVHRVLAADAVVRADAEGEEVGLVDGALVAARGVEAVGVEHVGVGEALAARRDERRHDEAALCDGDLRRVRGGWGVEVWVRVRDSREQWGATRRPFLATCARWR